MDWYPRNPLHYRRGTISWRDLAMHGAYCLLIDYYMETGEPIPDDDDAIASILRCDKTDWVRVGLRVRTKFIARDGKLHHEYCDEQLRKQADLTEKARNNGKLGGRPSRSKTSTKRILNPTLTEPGAQTKPASPPQDKTRQDKTEVREIVKIVADNSRASRASLRADYADPMTRKQRWQQKVVAFAQRNLPPHELRMWIAVALTDTAEGKVAFERMNARMRAEESDAAERVSRSAPAIPPSVARQGD